MEVVPMLGKTNESAPRANPAHGIKSTVLGISIKRAIKKII